MSIPVSSFQSSLLPDTALALDATYRMNQFDRRYIDTQILACEQFLSDLLINGLNGTWITLDVGSANVAVGDIVCSASTNASTVTRAVAGSALTNAGTVFGVVLVAASAGAKVKVALDGCVPPIITGLAAGAPGPVRLNTATGRAQKVASFGASDYPLGFVDNVGNLTLTPVPTGIAGAGGFTGGSDLAGNGTTTSTNQYVSAISFSSAAAGGTVAINGTSTAFQWAAGNTGPTWLQAQAAAGAGVDTTHHTQAAQSGQGGNFRVAIGKSTATNTAFFAVADETAVGGASTDYLRIVPASSGGFSLLYDNSNSGVVVSTTSAGSSAGDYLIITRLTSAKLVSAGPITIQPTDGNNFVVEGNTTGKLYWQFTTTTNGANSLTHETTSTSVTYKQADNTTNSATAAPTTVQAQNATGTTATGGALNLTSGTGTTIAGALNLQFGGTTLAAYNGNGRTLTRGTQAITSGPFTIAAAQYQNEYITITGTMTGACTVVFPNAAGSWFVDISAITGISGTNTLTFKSGTATTTAITAITTTSTIVMIATTGSNGIAINV